MGWVVGGGGRERTLGKQVLATARSAASSARGSALPADASIRCCLSALVRLQAAGSVPQTCLQTVVSWPWNWAARWLVGHLLALFFL